MGTRSRIPAKSSTEPQVRYERQLSVTSIGTLWLGRFLVGNEAGRSVLVRQISKNILAEADFSQLQQSAQAYAMVRHPSFVKLLGAVEQDGDLITLSEHLVGAPLDDILREAFDGGAPIGATIAVRIVLDAARATIKAHRLASEAGLFPAERLILPESIFLAAFGGTLLSEVGMLPAFARTPSGRTIADVIAQLAPEDLDSETCVKGNTEVFSLGVLLWETLANRRLFSRETASQTRTEVLTRPIAPLSSIERYGVPVPEPLVKFVQTATERDPHKRFSSLESFVTALEQLPAHFIATEHHVAEMLRQQAASLVLRCTVDDSQLMMSGTFSEVPPSRMSTRPPAAPEFEAEKPTFAQRKLITTFKPIDDNADSIRRVTDERQSANAALGSADTEGRPSATVAAGSVAYSPATSMPVPSSSVTPLQRAKANHNRKLILLIAGSACIVCLVALVAQRWTRSTRASQQQARPDTTVVHQRSTQTSRPTTPPNSQGDLVASQAPTSVTEKASPSSSATGVKDRGDRPTAAPQGSVESLPPPKTRTQPAPAESRPNPGSVYRPTQILPFRPKAI